MYIKNVCSKRLRLNDGYYNNLNSTLNSDCQSGTKWLYSGNTNFVETEILQDMGVGMLEDEISNSESIKTLQSEDCPILPTSLDNKRLLLNEPVFDYQEEIYTSCENTDRSVTKKSICVDILNLLIVFIRTCNCMFLQDTTRFG